MDAIAVLINGALVTDPSEVPMRVSTSQNPVVKYVFVQSKSGEKWDSGGVLKFTRAVEGFFTGADIGSSSVVENARAVHRTVLDNVVSLEENPRIRAAFVSSGRRPDGGAPVKAMGELQRDLTNLQLFSAVSCDLVDGAEMQKMYRSATSSASAAFDFTSKVTLPKIPGVEQAYLGLVPAIELMNLLTESGSTEIRHSVFEDNVRDYQGGDSPVNFRMRETVLGEDTAKFALMNNGITIVARDLKVTANTFRLTDYQIVNGAQTCHVLFENREAPHIDDIVVPAKIIQTSNEDLITDIVTATNSQTQIRVDQLNARAIAERNIEKYFAATDPPRNLLYERRARQYDSQGDVIKARVVDRYTLLRATAATFADEAHLSTGYPAQLLGRIASGEGESAGRRRYLQDTDEPAIYYAAASAYYRLDLFFKTGRLEARFKPARWHILGIARRLTIPGDSPRFGERRVRGWVQKFVDAVWDDAAAMEIFQRAIDIIERGDVDLSRTALRNASVTAQFLDLLQNPEQ